MSEDAWLGPHRVRFNKLTSAFRIGHECGFQIALDVTKGRPDSKALLAVEASLATAGTGAPGFCDLRMRPLVALDHKEARWIFEARMRTETAEWLTEQATPEGDLDLLVLLWGREEDSDGHSHQTVRFTVYGSQWKKVLHGMKLSHRVSMALEIPKFGNAPHFDKVAAHLEHAIDELRSGRRPRQVAVASRLALEALTHALGDDAELKKAGWDNRSTPVEERLRVVRKALWVLTGASTHGGEPEEKTPYGLVEARAALAMVLSVATAYCSRSGD